MSAADEAGVKRMIEDSGYDARLCSMRVPTSPTDMGRVFGQDSGLLVWVDVATVMPLLQQVGHDADELGALVFPAPGERFVFCLSQPVQSQGFTAPRFLCTAAREDGALNLTGWAGGAVEVFDEKDPTPLLAILLTLLAVNASRYPLAVSTRAEPRYDGERKRRNPPQVVMISLRPTTKSSEGDSGRGYRHRWEVRGHWRLQACGKGRAERRRIWVDSHEKGPADAPRLDHQKLYKL